MILVRVVQLGDFGEILLVTIGDSAFPQFAWLINAYNEIIRDNQKKYFNKRLYGARVVIENACAMLKGRWRILFKKTECQLFNLRYFVMTYIFFSIWVSFHEHSRFTGQQGRGRVSV